MTTALAAVGAAFGVLLVLAGMVRAKEAAPTVVTTVPDELDTFRAGLNESLSDRLLSGTGAVAEAVVRRLDPCVRARRRRADPPVGSERLRRTRERDHRAFVGVRARRRSRERKPGRRRGFAHVRSHG